MKRKNLLLLIFGLIMTAQMIYSQVPSYVPTNGLVGYWPFNGNANDQSGNGNNGTVISGLLSNDRFGNDNSSYYLNGQTDYITVPSVSSMLPNRLTLSAWVKIPSNYAGNDRIGPIIRSRFFGYVLWFDSSNGSIIHILHHNTSATTTTNTPSNINDNQWHQIVGTFDGTNNKLYLDGQLISTAVTTTLSNLYYVSDGPVAFGRDGNNPSTATAMYQGWIDDIGIWNRALSSTEIQQLYSACSTSAPTGNTALTLCSGSSVANLTATGTNIKWYATSAGGTALASTTALVNGTIYYASQTVNGCESITRLAVTVTLNYLPTAVIFGTIAVCKDSASPNITFMGTSGIAPYTFTYNINGGPNQTITTSLGNSVTLSVPTNTIGVFNYQLISVANSFLPACTNLITATSTVTVSTAAAPTGTASQTFCTGVTVSNLQATGTAIKWYSSATGGTALAATTTLVNGTTYYATQTVNGCESTTRLAVIVSLNDPTVSATATTVCSGQPTTLSASSGTSTTFNFSIGSIGPAGGYVFYDKGSVTNGWRYLEVASDDYGTPLEWGCDGTNIPGTSTPIGTGQTNTNLIIQNCNSINIAARACDTAVINGLSDWYLPSRDDFNLIYQNLNPLGVGNFINSNGNQWNRYWTSSQIGAFAYAQDFTPYFQQITQKVNQNKVRPIRQFATGIPFSSYLWSTAATTASISVNPTASTQYWVDVTTNGVTCRKFITITVNSITTAPTGSATQTLCSGSTVADLVATGTNIKWYTTVTGGTALSSTTALVSGTYYVSQTVNGCESSRLPVSIVVSSPTVPTFQLITSACIGSTINPLPTTSNNGIIGTWEPALNNSTTTTYTFTPTAGQCATTTSQTITITTPIVTSAISFVAPVATLSKISKAAVLKSNTIQLRISPPRPGCSEPNSLTANNITQTSANLSWVDTNYSTTGFWEIEVISSSSLPTGLGTEYIGTLPYPITGLTAGTAYNYYVRAKCFYPYDPNYAFYSDWVGPYNFSTSPLPTPIQNLCAQTFQPYNVNVGDATHNGSTYVWSISPSTSSAIMTGNGTNAITIDWSNVPSGTYTIQAIETSIDGCVSLPVTAIINLVPTAIPVAQSQTFCASATVADLVATGTSLQWYLSSTGGIALSTNTALESGTYYVSQTVNGCESSRLPLSIVITSPIVPTFQQVSSTCSGSSINPLPTTSLNGIEGTWSPALNNNQTTTYTFTPNTGQCVNTITQTIIITTPRVTSPISFLAPIASLSNVTIGTQVWTNKDLDIVTYRDGTPIPQVTDPTAWSNLTTGAWCYYNNDPANGAIYGKLYNWYAVAGIYDAASLANPALRKQLAPLGWHVPSDGEWTTLTTFLGGPMLAGGKMKSTGTSLWQSPNTSATNESGFTGVPGDYRNSNGAFGNNIAPYVTWWSSTQNTTSNAFVRYLHYASGTAYRSSYSKLRGYSVRLIKD